MRALVLGATGHIGSHIVRALLARGHQVRASFRSDRYLNVLEGLSVEKVHVDLETCSGLTEALSDCDWVFHAAGFYPRFGRGKKQEAVDKGILSTRRILEIVAAAKPDRFIFTSSAATIKHLKDRAANESDCERWPLQSERSVYATVKIAMEHEVLKAAQRGLPVVITKPSICIGEYDAHQFSGMSVLLFAKYKLPFYLDQRINTIYTGDVGIGHVLAAEKGKIGEGYLLTNHSMMLKDFAHIVAREAGVPAPRIRIPYPIALVAAYAMQVFSWITRVEPKLSVDVVRRGALSQPLDGTKAVKELGLPTTPIDEAVRVALSWFKNNGYLQK